MTTFSKIPEFSRTADSAINTSANKLGWYIYPLFDAYENAAWTKFNGKLLKEIDVQHLKESANEYKKLNLILNTAYFWEDTIAKNESHIAKKQLGKLKDRWLKHAEFSHYTPAGLINTAKIIVRMKAVIAKELSGFTLQSNMMTSEDSIYINYLSHTLQTINKKATNLAEAMLVRWENAAEHANLNAHDVTFALLEKLKSNHVNGLSLTDTCWQNQLGSANVYTQFYYFIKLFSEKYATPTTRAEKNVERLISLTQFSNQQQITLKKLRGKLRFIPAALDKDILKRPKYPQWLFARVNYFFNLFEKELTSSHLLKLSLTANPENIDITTWRLLSEQNKILTELIKETNKQLKPSLFSFFYRKSNRILKCWKDSLILQKKRVIDNQIMYLRNLTITPPLNHLFELPVSRKEGQWDFQSIAFEAQRLIDTITNIEDKIKLLATITQLKVYCHKENLLFKENTEKPQKPGMDTKTIIREDADSQVNMTNVLAQNTFWTKPKVNCKDEVHYCSLTSTITKKL